MFVKFFVLVVVGRLIIYLVQQFPTTKEIHNKFFHKLFNCDLCFGTWTYFILCAFMKFDFFHEMFYVPIVSEAITAMMVSWSVHVFVIGYKLKYGIDFED